MKKQDIVKYILRNSKPGSSINEHAFGWAPANIALCKYWGKRDTELNLPYNSSLSISLGNKGAFTHIYHHTTADRFVLNGKNVDAASEFSRRLTAFLDLFRPTAKTFYCVDTDTSIPVAAGLASSACGFAALIQALNNLYNWNLTQKDLSILARLGSGSACRSLWHGFVEWHRGDDPNGMDSYGEKLQYTWPELRIGILTISSQSKHKSSRDAMQHTVQTSPFYNAWQQTAEQDFTTIKNAIAKKDFVLLGETAEQNALAMHALMQSAREPIIYTLPETLQIMQIIWLLRKETNLPIYFTQDAGPNLKLLFLAEHTNTVLSTFPELEIIAPFADPKLDQVILVDEHDVEIGVSEKMITHLQAKLHRAFSVFILRGEKDSYEVLLQQRNATKYHSANLWSNTCCGHPRPDENTSSAAKRRLNEEMGIRIDNLTEIGAFHYCANLGNGLTEHEIDHVFIGKIDDGDLIHFNPDEVQNYRWVKLTTLEDELSLHPENYTAWLKPALDVLLQCSLN